MEGKTAEKTRSKFLFLYYSTITLSERLYTWRRVAVIVSFVHSESGIVSIHLKFEPYFVVGVICWYTNCNIGNEDSLGQPSANER